MRARAVCAIHRVQEGRHLGDPFRRRAAKFLLRLKASFGGFDLAGRGNTRKLRLNDFPTRCCKGCPGALIAVSTIAANSVRSGISRQRRSSTFTSAGWLNRHALAGIVVRACGVVGDGAGSGVTSGFSVASSRCEVREISRLPAARCRWGHDRLDCNCGPLPGLSHHVLAFGAASDSLQQHHGLAFSGNRQINRRPRAAAMLPR